MQPNSKNLFKYTFIVILAATLFNFSFINSTQAADTYKFYYTDKCQECVAILTSIKDNTKLVTLNIQFVDYSDSSTNLSQLKSDCKLSAPDNTKAYFYNGAKCFVGTAVSTEINRLAALQPETKTDTTPTPDTSSDTNTNTNTKAETNSTNPVKSNSANTSIPVALSSITAIEAIVMVIAPLTFIALAYMLIKRLKL